MNGEFLWFSWIGKYTGIVSWMRHGIGKPMGDVDRPNEKSEPPKLSKGHWGHLEQCQRLAERLHRSPWLLATFHTKTGFQANSVWGTAEIPLRHFLILPLISNKSPGSDLSENLSCCPTQRDLCSVLIQRNSDSQKANIHIVSPKKNNFRATNLDKKEKENTTFFFNPSYRVLKGGVSKG